MKIELDLTAEQLEKIKEMLKKEKKNPFDRVEIGERYYSILSDGEVATFKEWEDKTDDTNYNLANYCTNEQLIKKQALKEKFNRLLWRYAEIHNEPINWTDFDQDKYFIYYRNSANTWVISGIISGKRQGVVYFSSREIAEKAIEKIVLPFIEKHGMDWFF